MKPENLGDTFPEEPISEWGMLNRTQYLVLDRTMLEAMPVEWQKRFVAMMDEVEEEFDFSSGKWVDLEYLVKPKSEEWVFIKSPWGPYRYPNQEYIESVRKKPTNQ